jgi:hypothetical protein
VTDSATKLRNVIVCEDIRDEIGNKKSLMGVLTGDILVPAFPATIQIAVFFEYLPDSNDSDHLSIGFRLLVGDGEIVNGGMQATISSKQTASFALPKALITFENETTFKMLVSVNGRPEEEILSRRIGKAPPTS